MSSLPSTPPIRTASLPGVAEQQTYLGVQGLRGIAACMVVLHHAAELWHIDFSGSVQDLRWHNGAAGVDLFFVISGFVMALTASGRRPPTAGRFLSRRLIRILPMYWFVTAFVVLKAVLARLGLGRGVAHHLLTPASLTASLLLIPFRNAENVVRPVLPVGWTLSYELFFYLLFALALALRLPPLRLLAPTLLVLVMLGRLHPTTWPPLSLILDPLLLEFLGGVLIGHILRSAPRIHSRPLFAAACAGLGLFGTAALFAFRDDLSGPTRVLFWGLPALFIVQAVVFHERRIAPHLPRLLLAVGDASYSLYLVHALVVVLINRTLLRVHLSAPSEILVVSTALCGSALAGLLLYRLVERPLTRTLIARFALGSPTTILPVSAPLSPSGLTP